MQQLRVGLARSLYSSQSVSVALACAADSYGSAPAKTAPSSAEQDSVGFAVFPTSSYVGSVASLRALRQVDPMFRPCFTIAALVYSIGCCAAPGNAQLPPDISRQIAHGYTLLSYATTSFGRNQKYYFVALASQAEMQHHPYEARAPRRPLLIFERRPSGRYALIARNDEVILRSDEGGINGCDPFEGGNIVAKERYFTVEQGVACGAHWTDYATFRYDPRSHGYIFDNWRFQSWSLNSSNRPSAPALISDGRKIVRATSHAVPFAKWRRP